MARERPINAPAEEEPRRRLRPGLPGRPRLPGKPKLPGRPRVRGREKLPGALRSIGAAVLVAAVFLIAAIVGGGSPESDGVEGAAPPVGGTSSRRAPASTQGTSELGYPAFGTKNTTRIGGDGPAANAAGVALAVFPSTEPRQRPASVTLVDEADWAGAIAASVLVAPPVRSPILFSEAGSLSGVSEEALSALDPARELQIKARGSAAATAAAVARLRDRLFGGPPAHIVLVSEGAPAFAMPAAAWAARSGDPVLFTARDRLPRASAAALRRHPKTPVFVLGPSSAVSSEVFRQAGKAGGPVRRVSGETPVRNAIALARYSRGDFGWNVNDPGHGFVVARTDSPLDAAAAAPLSAAGTWGPLLLTDNADTLPKALRGYLLDVKPGYTDNPTRAFYNHMWVIGDQEAIDVTQQAEIDSLAELAKIGNEKP